MKRKQTQLAGLGFIAVAAMLLFIGFGASQSHAPPPTEPIGVDTNGDGVADTQIAYSTLHALHLVYVDGSDSWKYPNSRTVLAPYSILDNTKPVSSVQANLYFNVAASKQIEDVSLSCTAAVAIYDSGMNLFKSLGEQPISQVVANPTNGEDIQLVSSTITAQQLQALTVASNLNIDENFVYTIICRDFTGHVNFSDGTTCELSFSGTQNVDSQMRWNFRLIQSYQGGPLQVVSFGVTWI